MTIVHAEVVRSGHLPASREEVWQVLRDEARFGTLMPNVVRYEQVEDGWYWEMEGASPIGHRLRPSFTLRYRFDGPRRLSFDSKERHQDDIPAARGEVTLTDDDGGTEATMRLEVHVSASVPSLLVGPAQRFFHAELARLAEGFIDNLRWAVSD
ncbi:MAG: CoxG family protein [Nitriliruptorales bacterium]